ncbi:unnamed protein product [Prunus armeniaca]
MVRREAQRQITMLGSGTKIGELAVVFASKNTALVSQCTGSSSSAVLPRRLTPAEKDKLKCNHCGEKRHTINTCWALHGVPDWEKEQRHLKKEQLDIKAHVAVATTSVAGIITRHDHLSASPPTLTAVSSTPTPPPPCNFGKAFHAYDTRYTSWIIDSGATDHMTYNSTLFSTTLPPHRDHVLTANNVTAPVTGASSILLTHDIQTRDIFSRGTKNGGLYYMDDVATSRVLRAGSAETSQHCRICLLHYRFGHTSFGYLRHLFPALFSGVNESDFQCQTCILAKSHRVSYSPSCNKRLMPFDLVHYDVWGPSPVSTPLGGVLHETTCPQTPQQNGVAERKNGQILVVARALLLGASVPKRFWMDYVTYIVYRLNRLPSRVLDFQTPMQFDTKGELAEPAEPATPPKPATLAEPAILTDVTTVTEPIAPHEASLIVPDQAPLDIPKVSAFIHNSYVLPPRRNRGVPPDHYSPIGKTRYAIAHYVSNHRLSPECKVFVTRMDNIKIPTHVEEAFNDPKWAVAMNIEMEALQKNNTWDIVDLEKGTKPRYKTRLVAKGFTQTYGVDYHDTSAAVAKMNTVIVLLSLAVNLDWTLRQFDVKNAFLHGELEEEVYMSLPLGYRVTGVVRVKARNGHLDLEGYTDADYARNITDKRSTSGYFTFVGGNLVTWRSKKQNVVSRSSAKSEYRRIAQGVCEILWLRWLLAEIGFRPNAVTKLHCDNKSAFEIANNPVQHDRTKHVEVDWHFIKEKLEHKLISIHFVPFSEQLADMLTHALSKRRFEDSIDKLSIIDIYAPT